MKREGKHPEPQEQGSTFLRYSLVLFLFLFTMSLPARMSWWDPATASYPVLEGQGWPGETESFYDRFPARAKEKVRKHVWELSRHAAGLVIRFRSNASRIVVRYGVEGAFSYPHMPATGKSGIDLYARDSEGKWMWVRGRYSFGDTVVYDFKGIRPNDKYHHLGREYRLYLPLYNHVTWLRIGVPDTALFEPLPVRREKPLVIYGTSIAQGACAPRAGLAWSNLLERYLDRPVINLGFSGNGRLEKEVIDLLCELDPKLYIIDCLPNMLPPRFTGEEVRERLFMTVRRLRKCRPHTPILLVDHDGYADGAIQPVRKKDYEKLNTILHEVYARLKEEGVSDLWLLEREDLGQDLDSQTDGTHPNALGMVNYTRGYERIIRRILKEPSGETPATRPVTQDREPQHYVWEKRHEQILAENALHPPRIVFLGNSITHYWGGVPGSPYSRGTASWEKHLAPLGVKNMGCGWDRIENVLWRVEHDELDGYEAKQVILLIGTNNLFRDDDDEILRGLDMLVRTVRMHQPHARILLLGILPRKGMEERIRKLNLRIALLAGQLGADYGDIGQKLLDDNGKIQPSCFLSDGLHPNSTGYEKMAGILASLLKQ